MHNLNWILLTRNYFIVAKSTPTVKEITDEDKPPVSKESSRKRGDNSIPSSHTTTISHSKTEQKSQSSTTVSTKTMISRWQQLITHTRHLSKTRRNFIWIYRYQVWISGGNVDRLVECCCFRYTVSIHLQRVWKAQRKLLNVNRYSLKPNSLQAVPSVTNWARKRSCGKVMFLHLFTGIVWQRPPREDTPHPQADTPPPWADTHTHTQDTATEAGGTHPILF